MYSIVANASIAAISINAQVLSVGITLRVGGATTTVMVAVATPPVPPFVDETVPVVLVMPPRVETVTLTVNVHDEAAASVAPVRLTDPPDAEIVPPPQLPASPLGELTVM